MWVKQMSKAPHERTNHGESYKVFCFCLRSRNHGMATDIWSGNKFKTFRGKVPEVWYVLRCFRHCLFLIGNVVMVDLQRFSKSSVVIAKKALMKSNRFFCWSHAVSACGTFWHHTRPYHSTGPYWNNRLPIMSLLTRTPMFNSALNRGPC